MQENIVLLDNSGAGGGEAAASAALEKVAAAYGGGDDNGGMEERGRREGGKRWPREETLALLKIRSEMDLEFREAAVKAPLWHEVSKKLGDLGYSRSARKCKEKFENIVKYHRRTKDGRSGRPDGKSYWFCEQLEMFDDEHSLSLPSSDQNQPFVMDKTPTAQPALMKPHSVSPDFIVSQTTLSSNVKVAPSTPTSSSSDRDTGGSEKKGSKIAYYFENLMKEVLERQESLQNQLLNTLEKFEKDRTEREEAWKMQYTERVKKEQGLLANERAIAAAKDASIMALLQKISEQGTLLQIPDASIPESNPTNEQQVEALTPWAETNENKNMENSFDGQDDSWDKDIDKQGNGVDNSFIQSSTSRWPKEEVEALIRIRTNLSMHVQDGSKAPVWEEISSAMRKLGYDRKAKRCKEKWDNINKYYKRVKESQKRKAGNSKACPYFHLLDSIYEKKARVNDNLDWSGTNLRPEDILMEMMNHQQHKQSLGEDIWNKNVHQNGGDEAHEKGDEDNRENYQLVANNPSNMSSLE